MIRIALLFCLSVFLKSASAYTVNIVAPTATQKNTNVGHTLKDVVFLFEKAGVQVNISEQKQGNIQIILPEIPENEPLTTSDTRFPTFQVPVRDYAWTAEIAANGDYILTLSAPGASAVSAGIYGLLQDILGFHFYHPREMIVPDLSIWPLKTPLNYASNPRFNKIGFHIHSQHPLELTQALLDENFPGGENRVREYIDWLARNRQNYFEFCLLETINRKTWPAYAAKWVTYMEERGIIPGLDLSLHMKQQVAFKLYRNPHRSFRTKNNQIRQRIDELTQANWKVFNMEFSQTEFSAGNAEKKAELRKYVQSILEEKGIHLTGREHVVKPETMVDKAESKQDEVLEEGDNKRGTMIHTVMFYTLNDTLAPVYGNENLQHMREMMLDAKDKRETWYYPESAYWITFDNSIPMLLTPYLNARLEDILYCDTVGIEGHLTFSSGWEWGYWLIDWSIANWSWKYQINGEEQKAYPEQYFDRIFTSPETQKGFASINQFQNEQVKAQNLISFLTGSTVTDEMPGKFNLPLHPKPKWTYAWLRNDADKNFIDSLEKNVIPRLDSYAKEYFERRKSIPSQAFENKALAEIIQSTDMAALRAQHRAATLRFMCKIRLAEIEGNKQLEKSAYSMLDSAASVREKGLEIVRIREAEYRYPLYELSTKHVEKTAYHFGYLYPVHNLHLWLRDEEQARQNKWSPLFMNIWAVGRIIGLTEK